MFKIILPPLCVVSALLVLSAFLCQANDGTSLTINGDETINQIGTAHYSASANSGEVTNCRWSTSDLNFSGPGPFVTPDEDQCDITYQSFGSLTLKCDADVILNGTTKSVSSSKNISCQQPATNTVVTLSINGPGEVTINSTKTYTANYKGYDGVPQISWRYIGGTPTGNSINIHFVTNITHHLECTLRYKDANNNNQEVTAEMYIKVLPQVELSALRADYKDYTSAVISGTNLVYIHFNIDDDDTSYDNNDKRGTDCKQKEFADGKVDDDLCKIEISLGDNIDLEDITDGSLFFEVPVGLRLWKSPSRATILVENENADEDKLKIGYSFGNSTERSQLLSILTNGFYVEGVRPGNHDLTISFGSNELNLPYFCCSVGGITDQPEGSLRAKYKASNAFPNLVDCEWCVKKFANEKHLKTYNCIAYAVDSQREVFNGTNSHVRPFEGAFWVCSKVPLFDAWSMSISETKWREDPFLYRVSFTKQAWNKTLKTKFKTKFNDISIAPFWENIDNNIYRAGYTFEFKKLLDDVLEEQPNVITLENRYTTMVAFNRNLTSDCTNHFFLLSDFSTLSNNGHPLTSCGTNDNDRIVMYYSIIKNR